MVMIENKRTRNGFLCLIEFPERFSCWGWEGLKAFGGILGILSGGLKACSILTGKVVCCFIASSTSFLGIP